MPDLGLGRLRPVLDPGEQLRFHPDAFVRDTLGVGLGPADQPRQALPQFGGRGLVEDDR